VATDVDPRFVAQGVRDNLEVRRHDVASDPLEEASFDLVHARAVLEHLPDREQVLARLVRALRPGGWVVVEDVDFGGAMATAAARYVSPSEQAPVFERFFRAVEAVFRTVRADASFGARLLETLERASLSRLGADVYAPMVVGGGERDWVRMTVEQLRGPLVATGLVTEADVKHALRVMAESSCHFLPPLMVGAWGQRTTRGEP
jgi:SAM-dependent methyltransferase